MKFCLKLNENIPLIKEIFVLKILRCTYIEHVPFMYVQFECQINKFISENIKKKKLLRFLKLLLHISCKCAL